MRRIALTVLIVLALATVARAVGEAAPDFVLRDLNEKSYRLADYKGKVVVLSFWMTWCVNCKLEMPQLNKLYAAYHDKGVELFSITADLPSDMPKVKTIVRRYELTYPVLVDSDSRVNALLNHNSDYPLTIVIDKRGKIAWIHIGYQPGEEKLLEEEIKKALAAD